MAPGDHEVPGGVLGPGDLPHCVHVQPDVVLPGPPPSLRPYLNVSNRASVWYQFPRRAASFSLLPAQSAREAWCWSRRTWRRWVPGSGGHLVGHLLPHGAEGGGVRRVHAAGKHEVLGSAV